MTEEQQRISIAEACGWTPVQCRNCKPSVCTCDTDKPNPNTPPDYLNDLNAMHQVETQMDLPTFDKYSSVLIAQVIGWGAYDKEHIAIRATAAQRAEAFLRTIGKWEEQSEHECDKQLPIGSCLACDLLQLERELATVTEQRDNAIEMGNRTRDNSGAIIASQVVENIMLTQQRDRMAKVLRKIRSGYGGQITDPDCNCGDCEFLIQIDTALQYLTPNAND